MGKEPAVEDTKNSVWESRITNGRYRLFILGGVALLGLLITPFLAPAIENLLICIGKACSYFELCNKFFPESNSFFGNLDNGEGYNRFRVNLSLLVMSLPVLLALWWFRTHDTREQIKKAEQQIDASIESRETSTRDSQLSTGLQLIADTDVAARCIGLIQLVLVRSRCQELEEKLRKQLEDQIDASTQNLTLYRKGKDDSEEVIKLSGAMLQNLNLKGAIMKKAQLLEADLRGANLVGADLREANLMGADLRGAHLDGANLEAAHLEGAHLEDAILEGANLTKAQLLGAKLTRANLERATLIEAHLHVAPLQITDLEGANLKGARLDDAYLMGTVLIGADLTKSNVPLLPSLAWLDSEMIKHLISTDSGGANLGINATLLEGADLRGATYDSQIGLPPYPKFDPEARGMIKVD